MAQLMQSIPLCSRCAVHELTEWINEKLNCLNIETTQKIREEIKSIKLTEGECIVCRKQLVSDRLFESVLKVFEKNQAPKEITEEFRRLFFY